MVRNAKNDRRSVHCASLVDHCHVNPAEIAKHTQMLKESVVLRERRQRRQRIQSSFHRKKKRAARFVETTDGQGKRSQRRHIGYTQLQMSEAPKLLRVTGKACPQVCFRVPPSGRPEIGDTVGELLVPLERNLNGHSLAASGKIGRVTFFCNDVLMRDSASAAEEVKQISYVSSYCDSRERGVPLWELMNIHIALKLLYHVAPVPSNLRRVLDHIRGRHMPTRRLPDWIRQPNSVLRFLPAVSFWSTPPRLHTIPRHRPASPWRCRTRTPQPSPTCASAKTWRVWPPSSRRHWLPRQHATLPRRPGRNVAPSSEFHEGVKATQKLSQPPQGRGPYTIALLELFDTRVQS